MRRLTTLLACLGALFAAAPAEGAIREYGVNDSYPLVDPSCPADCQAIGRVTGFPAQIAEKKNPMLVNQPGTVVGFSVRLGTPTAEQTSFFSNLFGGEAQVRLSVLQPWRTKRKHRLVAQSEVFNVQDYFGSTPTFALKEPIRVGKRRILALTVPTWVPAFAVNQPATTAWRFSRDNCNNAEESAAQQRIRSNQVYDCFKRTARPIYTVYFIRDPKKTTRSPSSGSRASDARGSSSNSDAQTGGVRP